MGQVLKSDIRPISTRQSGRRWLS